MQPNQAFIENSHTFDKQNKNVKPKGKGNDYHWKLTDPLADLDPLFAQEIPAWKRAMDIIGAMIGILLFSPLLLIYAVFIKIACPGPVFFKQERVGYGGKLFSMIKLRTMENDTDSSIHRQHMQEIIKSDDGKNHSKVISKPPYDSKVFPFGEILRTSAIDELPQLYNVLIGDMSLIGPRPPIPYEVDEYKHWYSGRFDTVPGMTGLWQVCGKNKLPFTEMVRLDIRYIQSHSFWLDLKILLLTPQAIISQIRDRNC